MEKYFAYLEQLRQSGETNMFGAVPYLQREFPELSKEKSQQILTAWMSAFGTAHVPGEGYSSAAEAEVMFRFGSFLSDIASHICSEAPEIKCRLCVRRGADKKNACLFGCYDGVTEYLSGKAALYQTRLESCCKRYFEYLDQIHTSKDYDLYSAEEALKTEFPYLTSHPEYAKYAMASWMLKHWG